MTTDSETTEQYLNFVRSRFLIYLLFFVSRDYELGTGWHWFSLQMLLQLQLHSLGWGEVRRRPQQSHSNGTNFLYLYENETTGPTLTVSFFIADGRHSLFGHICRLPDNIATVNRSSHWHPRPPLLTGSVRRVIHENIWLQQMEKDIGLSVGAAQIWDRKPRSFDVRPLRPSAGQAQQWEWVLYAWSSYC